MNTFIVCSKCGHPIPIAEAMAAAMETELKQQVEGERERINRELSANSARTTRNGSHTRFFAGNTRCKCNA